MTLRPALSALALSAALAACGGSRSGAGSACGAMPALSVRAADVEAAIGYPATPGDGTRNPVLLVHGTGSTSFESWAGTYLPALAARGFSVYTIDLPGKAYSDIQPSSEYLVYAVRKLHALTGRKVDIIGHSQGGLEPRWALKWWPDVRGDIGDLITLATPHHGTVIVGPYCLAGCKPAHRQMAQDSQLIAALNDGAEVFDGVDVTSLYSLTDELVQPQFPSSVSALKGASNIEMQSLCPGLPIDHVGMMSNGAVFALVLDALTHDGPADAARFNPLSCADVLIPGIGPVQSLAAEYYFFASGNSDVADAAQEPPLADYVCK